MVNKQSLKLFVVDDDAFSRELICRHLMNMGFNQIFSFSNSGDCLQEMNQQPDILFLDYEMGPHNGLELIERVKERNQAVYMLMVSGCNLQQVAVAAVKNGAFRYISKNDEVFDMINLALHEITTEIANA